MYTLSGIVGYVSGLKENSNFTISNCKNNKNVKATVWASAYTTFDEQDKGRVVNSGSSNTGTISGIVDKNSLKDND